MALSKPASSYLEEMLTCAVCIEQLREPQTLMQCLHNYCKPCVQQLMASQNNPKPGVTCPVCRKFSAENEIRSNHFVNDLLGLHKASEASQKTTSKCEQCPASLKGERDARWKCLDCRLGLCDDCKESHLYIPILKGHRILPFNEETEIVVDRLVFCTTHDNTPIEFFCTECQELLCSKCYIVTNHRSHDIVTIETALKKLLPEIEGKTPVIDKKLEKIKFHIKLIDDTIQETEIGYSTCSDTIDENAKVHIKAIQDEQKRLHEELIKKKEFAKNKLLDVKEVMLSQQKETENLQRVVNASVDRARHASLLTELIQGGIYDALKRAEHEEMKPPKIELDLPRLHDNNEIWKSLQQKGLLGKVDSSVMSVVFGMEKGLTSHSVSSPRFYSGSVKEFFSKPLKKTVDITLNALATRLCIIDDKVWVPVFNNVIQIYSKAGNLERSINISKPVSLAPSHNGDVLVACESYGLCSVSKEGNTTKIADGSYSDVVEWNGKILAWEYNRKMILEFQHDSDGKWKETTKLDMNHVPGYYLDTFYVYQHHLQEALGYFIVPMANHSIHHVDEKGQLVKQYTDAQGVKFNHPMFCGFDRLGHLLVADMYNFKYKLLDIQTEQWSEMFTCESYVYDAIIDSDQAVWFVKFNGRNYAIAKYEH